MENTSASLASDKVPKASTTTEPGSTPDIENVPSAVTNNSVLTIEHKVQQQGSSRNSFLEFLMKPYNLVLITVVLLATGSWAFFLSQFLRIPGLNDQIEQLEAEVDRLEAEVERLSVEVDRLSEENDRYAELNDQLNATVQEFALQNEQLRESNMRYAELNEQLNASNAELERLVNTDLAAENQALRASNAQLNATVSELTEEVDVLENITAELRIQNELLVNQTEELSDEVETLSNSNEELNATITALTSEITELRQENDNLESLNQELITIVSFLNETNQDFQSFDGISSFLAEQITVNSALLIESLQNTYQQRILNWDCAYRDVFRGEDFIIDGDLPIGATNYPAVINHVEERVISDLCLDTSDVELYLETFFVTGGTLPPVSVTSNQLITGVQIYLDAAFDYYFPDAGENGGLTTMDWADASYDCENLPDDLKFVI